jgi:hypothetical protein
MIEIHPLGMIGEIQPGGDLVAILSEALDAAGLSVNGADVLVVTQKIISKAEDRYVALDSVSPSEEALRLAKITQGSAPRGIGAFRIDRGGSGGPECADYPPSLRLCDGKCRDRSLQYRERRSRAAAS